MGTTSVAGVVWLHVSVTEYILSHTTTNIFRLSESQAFLPHDTWYRICKKSDTMSVTNLAGTVYMSGYLGSLIKCR